MQLHVSQARCDNRGPDQEHGGRGSSQNLAIRCGSWRLVLCCEINCWCRRRKRASCDPERRKTRKEPVRAKGHGSKWGDVVSEGMHCRSGFG